MDKETLLNIIRQGENKQTEFKQSFNRQAIETLVAFANTKGGRILLGVTDKNTITGAECNYSQGLSKPHRYTNTDFRSGNYYF